MFIGGARGGLSEEGWEGWARKLKESRDLERGQETSEGWRSNWRGGGDSEGDEVGESCAAWRCRKLARTLSMAAKVGCAEEEVRKGGEGVAIATGEQSLK